MTSSTLSNLAIGLAVIAYLCARQLRWRPVDARSMGRIPLIMGVVGVVLMARQGVAIHPVDVVILGLSVLVALVSGALMGGIARYRPSAAEPGRLESRTGWLGVAIWVGLIVIRVGLDVAGHRMGSELAVSTGSILLVLAVNRAANAAVILARRQRRAFTMAGQ
jgi:hypothetical protein